MDPLTISTGIAFGVELAKWAMQERAAAAKEKELREKMAAAGMPSEAIDDALNTVRAKIAALPDPNKLPEV